MSTHIAHFGFSLDTLRAALRLPRRAAPSASSAPAQSVAAAGWVERLAVWAERQPMHHRMGGYMLLRYPAAERGHPQCPPR
jgi:hypothetical protein